MSPPLTLNLPDELYQPLLQVASRSSQTPEEWILSGLRERLATPDARLRRHFGAIDLGAPTGADNTQIDADLGKPMPILTRWRPIDHRAPLPTGWIYALAHGLAN